MSQKTNRVFEIVIVCVVWFICGWLWCYAYMADDYYDGYKKGYLKGGRYVIEEVTNHLDSLEQVGRYEIQD